MAENSLLAPDNFPVLYENGEPTAILVDIDTFRRLQFILDNWLNREAEPEDEIIAASDWLKNVLEELDKVSEPSVDWEKELDAMSEEL